MGLFDKKFCDICQNKIGLLGNRKLEDGNLCKDCAKKLSPFFSERRSSTVEDIRRQLNYREANKAKLPMFNPNLVLGESTKVYIDSNMEAFIVTKSNDWRNENPDIIDLSQVISCDVDIDEHRQELYQKNSDGSRVSYVPPRYKYEYEFTIRIMVNSPWFSQIEFELTNSLNRPDSQYTESYRVFERKADQIKCALMPLTYGIKSNRMNNAQNVNGGMYNNQMNTSQASVSNSQPRGNTFSFRCDKCGWEPSESEPLGKYCPCCGDVIDMNDIKR